MSHGNLVVRKDHKPLVSSGLLARKASDTRPNAMVKFPHSSPSIQKDEMNYKWETLGVNQSAECRTWASVPIPSTCIIKKWASTQNSLSASSDMGCDGQMTDWLFKVERSLCSQLQLQQWKVSERSVVCDPAPNTWWLKTDFKVRTSMLACMPSIPLPSHVIRNRDFYWEKHLTTQYRQVNEVEGRKETNPGHINMFISSMKVR